MNEEELENTTRSSVIPNSWRMVTLVGHVYGLTEAYGTGTAVWFSMVYYVVGLVLYPNKRVHTFELFPVLIVVSGDKIKHISFSLSLLY